LTCANRGKNLTALARAFFNHSRFTIYVHEPCGALCHERAGLDSVLQQFRERSGLGEGSFEPIEFWSPVSYHEGVSCRRTVDRSPAWEP
jgi:hypothetical protein